MASNFNDRVSKAAELLAVEPESLTKTLESSGIKNDSTGILLLEASTTSLEDIIDILKIMNVHRGVNSQLPKLHLKAAASILKDKDPFGKEKMQILPNDLSNYHIESITEVIKSTRPLEQQNDRELLERYAKVRDCSIEQELHKRAKQQNFIVLKQGKFEPGKEEIDIEMSLDLLKAARKRTNPSIVSLEGRIVPVYKIIELNLDDRIIELCPICNDSLYRGYCQKCNVNFSGIGDDERAYIHMVSNSGSFNSTSISDRKAIMTSALKGVEDLKQTWPSIAQEFDEKKAMGHLPKLRIIANRPSQADLFFQDGNRVFGNKSY